MTISAKGILLERIEKGATVNLEVKWGLITLIKQTVDLCDELKNVDLECPLEKGEMVLTKEVDLPKQIPPVRCFDNRLRAMKKANVLYRANTPFLPMFTTRSRTRSLASRRMTLCFTFNPVYFRHCFASTHQVASLDLLNCQRH